MAPLDLILLIVFGALAVGGLAGAVWCVRKAMRVANQRDGDLKMFGWASLALIGLIIAGTSAAYILLPIIL